MDVGDYCRDFYDIVIATGLLAVVTKHDLCRPISAVALFDLLYLFVTKQHLSQFYERNGKNKTTIPCNIGSKYFAYSPHYNTWTLLWYHRCFDFHDTMAGHQLFLGTLSVSFDCFGKGLWNMECMKIWYCPSKRRIGHRFCVYRTMN